MILTPTEYAKAFMINKRKVSAMTVKRRCNKGMLPKNHIPRKTPGGYWIIEVIDN